MASSDERAKKPPAAASDTGHKALMPGVRVSRLWQAKRARAENRWFSESNNGSAPTLQNSLRRVLPSGKIPDGLRHTQTRSNHYSGTCHIVSSTIRVVRLFSIHL